MEQMNDSLGSASPAEIRAIFGENLKKLCIKSGSIAALCRDLKINRTQFNRYLSGESFPRPDVLAKICMHFKIDARILLQPVESLESHEMSDLLSAELGSFLDLKSARVAPETLPSGFYRFSRKSFMESDRYVQGLILIYRKGFLTFGRGMEAKEAVRQQGLPVDRHAREFKGLFVQQEGGITALMSRRGSLTVSFNYLSKVPSFENNYWVGYATRTVPEAINATRVARMVYEYIGPFGKDVLDAARISGFCNASKLRPYHQTLLQVETPFQ
jgi:transcriptional regulator with XRE-family HTH domain